MAYVGSKPDSLSSDSRDTNTIKLSEYVERDGAPDLVQSSLRVLTVSVYIIN